MSSIAHSPQATPKRSRVGMIATALATFVAVAVAVFFITLPGGSATHPVSHHASARYAPLIQYHGTGAAPQTAGSAAVAPDSAPRYVRAEHSYGMVP